MLIKSICSKLFEIDQTSIQFKLKLFFLHQRDITNKVAVFIETKSFVSFFFFFNQKLNVFSFFSPESLFLQRAVEIEQQLIFSH